MLILEKYQSIKSSKLFHDEMDIVKLLRGEVRIWFDSNEDLVPASKMMSPTSPRLSSSFSSESPSSGSRMPACGNMSSGFSRSHWTLPNVPLFADLHPNHQYAVDLGNAGSATSTYATFDTQLNHRYRDTTLYKI